MSITSSLTAIANEIGPSLAARASEQDLKGELSADNYRLLREKKLFSAGIPRELGGGGASHTELCEMLRTLAHYCPSTSLALSMHTHLVATAVWRHLHGQPAAPLLKKVADGELVLVSTGANDWLDSQGTARKVEGGYRITSHKRFASGSPQGDMTLTSAPYDDPEQGPIVLHFALSLRAEGVSLGNDWDTLGMRATGSHSLKLEDVFVPEESVSVKRPRGQWHPSFSVICTVALPLIVSTYVGIAEKAAEVAREGAKKKSVNDPVVISLIGEMQNALAIAQMARREMMENARDYDFPPEIPRADAALIRKTIASEHSQLCVKKAVEASGGAAFFRGHPLERMWRDVQAAHFHPLPEKKQLAFTGRVALGLSPV